MEFELKILHPLADTPKRQTPMSAGFDLQAMVQVGVVLRPGEDAVLIPTGLAIHLAEGYAALILPRSGLGHKKGLVLGNTIGLIDGDYQGQIYISAWNRGKEDIEIHCKDRIAQLVVVPITLASFKIVDQFTDETERGAGGFGSTGL